MSKPASPDIGAERRKLMLGALIALPIGLAVWFGLFFLLPPVEGMEEPFARFVYALNWCGIVILLTFVTAIEAVSHERLFTPAINPLAGKESRRMRINLRYLQHSLEQLVVFVPGLLLLSQYCSDGGQMRAITATAVVWLVFRIVFWIGYHISPSLRTPGLIGMVMGMGLLIYVAARFGYDLAGPIGAAVPLVLFGGAEAFLVWISRQPSD